MVSNARSHHDPLRPPTLLYEILLEPTSPHFSPHNRLLLGFVKRKTNTLLKYVAHRNLWKGEENHRHRLRLAGPASSTPSGVFLRALQGTSEPNSKPTAAPMQQDPSRPDSSKIPIPCASWFVLLFSSSNFAQGALSHGMGYPSTPRNRPQLRDQLVRQRRALTFQAYLGDARLPRRAFCPRFPSLNCQRGLSCPYAY